MRLLWLSHFLPYPPRGGALQRSHHLLRQAAREYEVHLVALNQRALLPETASVEEAVHALRDVCATVTALPIPADATAVRWGVKTAIAYFRKVPYDVAWLESRAFRRVVEGAAREGSWELAHVDTLGLAPHIRSFGQVPTVLNHHNVESHMMRRRAAREPRLWRRVYFSRDAGKLVRHERAWCGRVQMNLVVSDLDADRLRGAVGHVPMSVVRNGVDMSFFSQSGPRLEEPVGLMFAGGLDWYPNREAVRFFVREVWPLLAAGNPDRIVTLIGRNPPADLLAAARNDPRIRVPGFVDDVRPYLRRATAYVCPIRDGGGTRLKVLDALAMGVPLVATRLAVEGLDLADGVHYLLAETPEAFAAGVQRLETQAGLRSALSEAGRRFVAKHFAWDRIGDELLRAYEAARRSPAGVGPSAKRV